MKCLIFSDSHGNGYSIRKILAKHPDAEVVFFLGDGLSDIEELAYYDRERTWICVRGNCDMRPLFRGAPIEKVEEITLLNKKIVATHGDLYNAKWGTDGLLYLAESRGADIVLFGHTHCAYEEYVNEKRPVYLFNPGAMCSPDFSYGILTLGNGVLFSHGTDI